MGCWPCDQWGLARVAVGAREPGRAAEIDREHFGRRAAAWSRLPGYGSCRDKAEGSDAARAGRGAAPRARRSASRHNDVEFERDGVTFRVHVPDEVELKIELEVGDDGSELEIELTW